MKLPLKRRPSPSRPARRRLEGAEADRSMPVSPKVSVPKHTEFNESRLFQRNLTITGSRHANVSSAAEDGAHLKSPRAAAHNLRRKRRSILSKLAFVTLGCFIVSVFLYQFTAKATITMYGQVGAMSDHQQNQYQKVLKDYYSRYPLQRFIWSLDKTQLAEYMHQRGVTEVLSIKSISHKEPGHSVLTVKMREPLASWTIDGRDQYVDESGVIFSTNFYAPPKVKIIDESGVRIKGTKTVASSRFLSFIGQTVGYFTQYGMTPKAVIIPPHTTRQAQIETQDGTRLKLTVDRRAGEQTEDGVRAARFLQSKQLASEYIDVRVSGKAYYKLK